ncbi:hypothetical protein H4S02_000387 [Coemansia sp. RSA 2611]|nr:hypothetical protein IWW52_000313 [Coemansia sp. RSA 2704]KAJ2393144.1 hypothetical protein H4S02_000387 [Coemansia sp. RSA 2611]
MSGERPELRHSLSAGGARASVMFQQLHESVANRQSVATAPWGLRRSMTTIPAHSEHWWTQPAEEHSADESDDETAPLLAHPHPKPQQEPWKATAYRLLGYVVPLKPAEQTAVFKAVLAYAVAGLFPFVGGLRDWLGDPEYMSPHLVTNATIWYHAAKTRSGLAEGGLVGAVWVSVTSLMTFTALYVAEWLHRTYASAGTHEGPDAVPLAIQSKIASLLFIFVSSWCMAFFKANAQRPSVGTATAIANIALYLVMLREAPIVNYKDAIGTQRVPWPGGDEALGESVGKKTEHILVAVLTGMAISLVVGWVVRPTTAGDAVRRQLRAAVGSFRDVLPQLVSAVLGARGPEALPEPVAPAESAASAPAQKLHGAKPSELKDALRAHRTQLQQLRRQVDAVALDPSAWAVWSRRTALAKLLAGLDGLSLHLGSMGAALELQANGAAAPDATTYTAVVRQIRAPVSRLARVADRALVAMHDMADAALAGENAGDVTRRVEKLRSEIATAVQVFQTDYDAAVRALGVDVELATASNATEEQLFVTYFFVFGLRELVDDIDALLPRVAAVCRTPMPVGIWSAAAGVRWAQACWRALWDTGATTALETRHESAQYADPRSLHAPRPAGVWARIAHALWQTGMWLRRANVRFAIKYALLATVLALPWYWSIDMYLEMRRQRMEWAVISAAAIMVPTVGGSALVSVFRVLGTCAGGLGAFLVYEVGQNTPLLMYVLLVAFSVPCFHVMLHGRYPRIGQFALITFGVVLVNKWVAREDQLESAGELAARRTFAVALGVVAGMLVTMYVWPFEARVRVRQAMSWWLLTASLLYDQLWAGLWRSAGAQWRALNTVREYLDSELQLQDAVLEIRALLGDTLNEPRLKGRFPVETYQRITHASQRILDALVAARWVMLPVPTAYDPEDEPLAEAAATSSDDSDSVSSDDTEVLDLPIALSSTVYLECEQAVDVDYGRSRASTDHSDDDALTRDIQARVEKELLQRTAAAREHRDALVALTMYVLASALVLKTPLPAVLPPVRDAQQRVADAVGDILEPEPESADGTASAHELAVQRAVARIRYSFYYTQVMLGWEIVHELAIIGGLMRELYGSYGS